MLDLINNKWIDFTIAMGCFAAATIDDKWLPFFMIGVINIILWGIKFRNEELK